MKKRTFFISVAAFCMSCVCSVGYGQNHTSAVGVLLPSDKSPYSPLHVYSNSSYVKSGHCMWSTYTQPNLLGSSFANANVNKNLFLYTDGTYPSNYVVHDGFHAEFAPANPRTSSQTWWERRPFGDEQRWGSRSTTYMQLNSTGLKLTISGTPIYGVNTYQLPSSGDYGLSLAVFEGNPGGSKPIKNVMYIKRVAPGSTWETVHLYDAVSTEEMSGSSVSQKSLTWWSRGIKDTIQAWGHKTDTYMTLKGRNLGIGVENPTNALDVNGTISAKKVVVSTIVPAPDYVFAPDYKLLGLNEVEDHINEHQHLPEVPSAAEMAKDGVDVIDLNFKLLQKVEELTLYIIAQNKDIQQLQKEVNDLQQQK